MNENRENRCCWCGIRDLRVATADTSLVLKKQTIIKLLLHLLELSPDLLTKGNLYRTCNGCAELVSQGIGLSIQLELTHTQFAAEDILCQLDRVRAKLKDRTCRLSHWFGFEIRDGTDRYGEFAPGYKLSRCFQHCEVKLDAEDEVSVFDGHGSSCQTLHKEGKEVDDNADDSEGVDSSRMSVDEGDYEVPMENEEGSNSSDHHVLDHRNRPAQPKTVVFNETSDNDKLLDLNHEEPDASEKLLTREFEANGRNETLIAGTTVKTPAELLEPQTSEFGSPTEALPVQTQSEENIPNEVAFSEHECSVCNKKFNQASLLVRHHMVHTREKPHECSHCDKKFWDISHLKRHTLTHTSERFRCDTCGKRFVRKDRYEDHVRQHEADTAERRYECNVCNQKFRFRATLRGHYLLHSAEKRFECTKCGVKYRQKHQLTRHSRVHNAEWPYKCDLCDRRFTRKDCLNLHSKSHDKPKSYDCDICKRKFKLQSSLGKHYAIHTEEGQLECKQCDIKFKRKTNLVRHLRLHNGEKPFLCDLCPKQFIRLDYLKRHKKEHQDEDGTSESDNDVFN